MNTIPTYTNNITTAPMPLPTPITTQAPPKPIVVKVPKIKKVIVPKIKKVYVPSKKKIYVQRPPSTLANPTTYSASTSYVTAPTPVLQTQVPTSSIAMAVPNPVNAPMIPVPKGIPTQAGAPYQTMSAIPIVQSQIIPQTVQPVQSMAPMQNINSVYQPYGNKTYLTHLGMSRPNNFSTATYRPVQGGYLPAYQMPGGIRNNMLGNMSRPFAYKSRTYNPRRL